MAQSDRAAQSTREPVRGCMVEVDTLALDGLRGIFKACGQALKAHGVTLDEGLFCRYLLGAHLEPGLARLLQAAGRAGPVAELARQIQESYGQGLAAAAVPAASPLVKLVATLAGRQVKVGLVTRLPEETATAVLAPLLAQPGVILLCEAHGNVGSFNWDAWRRNTRKMQMVDRLCVALVASGPSGKTALAAGLSVVVVADAMTAHQDFTGADHVAESFGDDVTKAVLHALRLID